MTAQALPVREAAFSNIVEAYRRELQVHCYRMTGSFEDAEDLVQETFLRAWRRRESFEGRSTVRTWLYRIATNACLDALARRPRRVSGGAAEITWLEPFPDRLLDEAAAPEDEPDAVVAARETIELAFLAAIQHLPPRQRAVLVLRDVLGRSAREAADMLETSIASVNSALQRARGTLKAHLPERRLEWAPGADPTQAERALLERYLDATERADADGFLAILREDARFSMPPQPGTWVGREAVVESWRQGGAFDEERLGHMRGLVTRVNRQAAVACYLRRPGDALYRPLAIDVLRIEEGAVAEIVTFPLRDPALHGLPATLEPDAAARR